MKHPTAAEFFAGIGLVRMGLEQAGWKVVFANDISQNKFAIYKDNFGPNHFRLDDIRNIKTSDIPDISLATASFPCIDLSLAGNRKGLSGRHSSAYWEFFRILEGMGKRRPTLVMLENVVGLLSSNQGKDLCSILTSLGELGYTYDLLLIDARHFVPQSRPRLFVIGVRHPSNNPHSKLQPHESRPRQIVEFIAHHQGLNWRHILLPPLPQRKHDLEDIVERFKVDSKVWWDHNRHAHLFRQMSNLHRGYLTQLMKSNRLRFATVYKRVRESGCKAELRIDGIAGCLRTPKGGSSKQFLIQAGRGSWRVRNLTAREYARLQGVPDSFHINTPYNQALFGFGDAVCVNAVEWVANYALNPLMPH